MRDALTAAIIQREIIPNDPAGNLFATLDLLNRCAQQEVDLIVLSELWCTGLLDPTDPASLELAESMDGPTIEALQEFSASNSVNLVAGSLAIQEKDKLRNRSLVFNRSGEIVLQYDKIHLFSQMGEDRVFSPGETPSAVEIDGVGIGVMICYDLRFPDLARQLTRSGCEVIVVPAMWPEVRINQWEILLRGRAVENQVYMIGANGLANQGGMFFPGHSFIVSSTGESLNSPEMRDSVIVRKLDIAKLRTQRSAIFHVDEERSFKEVRWHNR